MSDYYFVKKRRKLWISNEEIPIPKSTKHRRGIWHLQHQQELITTTTISQDNGKSSSAEQVTPASSHNNAEQVILMDCNNSISVEELYDSVEQARRDEEDNDELSPIRLTQSSLPLPDGENIIIDQVTPSSCNNAEQVILMEDNNSSVDELYDSGVEQAGPDEEENGSSRLLYNGTQITEQEAELLIMMFAIRHSLSDVGIEDLLHLFNILLPRKVFNSKYLFLKKFENRTDFSKKYFCAKCNIELPPFSPLKRTRTSQTEVICAECQTLYKRENLNSSGQFFIHIPIRPQLQTFVNSSLYDVCMDYKKKNYSDIHNGAYYKKLQNKGVISTYDLTLQFNTDGVNPFESSSLSLWPIQIIVNELPYAQRRTHIILAGLWFSKMKLDIDMYFKDLVDELISLQEDGVCRTTAASQQNIKFHMILCSVDSVARPMLQGLNQFNGRFGCSFCLAEGELLSRVLDDGTCSSNVRIYRKHDAPLRTSNQHFHDGREAILESNKPVNGVKGPTILSLIPNFGIIDSFSTDYLHNVCLGTAKTLTDTWLDSTNHNYEWYIGNKSEDVDSRLLKIRPPTEITRIPRSVTQRAKWKGSEWRNFVIYYSAPCLLNILPKKFFKHWMLLVNAIKIYLQPRIEEAEAVKAKKYIIAFVENTESLYGPQECKFNMHLLTHIPKCVDLFGSLWAHSTFLYEGYNGIICKMFNQTKAVPQQIIKHYLRYRKVQQHISKHFNGVTNIREIIMQLSETKILQSYDNDEVAEFKLSLSHRIITLSMSIQVLITQTIGEEVDEHATSYSAITIRGMLCHASDCESLQKRYNSFVELQDGTFVTIKQIFKVSSSSEAYSRIIILCEPLRAEVVLTSAARIPKFYHPLSRCKGVVNIITPLVIRRKCIGMEVEGQLYLCQIINHFERD